MKKKLNNQELKRRPIIVHDFDFKSVFDFVKNLSLRERSKNFRQEYNSRNFHNRLHEHTPLDFFDFKHDFNDTLYRISTFDVTSIEGNLSHGGRFNVGGSQSVKFIEIKPFAALYFSTDLECAIEEYVHGTPLGPKDIKYALTPAHTFKLWDLNKVIKFLNFPNLIHRLHKGPIFGEWCYCKLPMESQILAFWLKQAGGDGIFFRSTQVTESYCIALFIRDHDHAKSLFFHIKNIK